MLIKAGGFLLLDTFSTPPWGTIKQRGGGGGGECHPQKCIPTGKKIGASESYKQCSSNFFKNQRTY